MLHYLKDPFNFFRNFDTGNDFAHVERLPGVPLQEIENSHLDVDYRSRRLLAGLNSKLMVRVYID
jgi:hypothetical protein